MGNGTIELQAPPPLTYEQFMAYLRSALHYLYDPVHLRSSPLVELLGVTHEFDRAAALQQLLSQSIRQLKPAAEEAPQSRAWRIYDTLHLLYIRQLERPAMALQLGISERQLRREQRVALEQLAQELWQQLDRGTPATSEPPTIQNPLPVGETNQALSEELLWLKNSASEPRISLRAAISTVQNVAQPMAQQWQVALQVDIPADLAEIPVAPLALRSILLTLLGVAIPRASAGAVILSARSTNSEIEYTVRSLDHSPNQMPFSEKENASLQTAYELATFYTARLVIPPKAGPRFIATLTLHIPERTPILVIDDNADWLELLHRYAADTHYQIIGERAPEQALSLAEKVQPALIFLDVMMQNVDGWQVLSELRHDPATERIPVIICTILPVGELALALGANQFLQKPVTQQQFLQVLSERHRWVDEA